MSFSEGKALTSEKPRRVQSCFWKCNYHLSASDSFEKIFESIESKFKPLCKQYIFSEEYGGTKETPHVEGYLVFKRKTEFQAIQKIFKFSDLQKSLKKNSQAGIDYCRKEGNALISLGLPAPLKPLACEKGLYDWEKDIIDIIDTPPDDRKIYWIWSEKGTEGKTTFCKYLHRKYGAICLGGKSADMKHGIIEYRKTNGFTPELILINIPRSFNQEYLSYTGIEEVKDMFFYSGKYEGGMVDGNNPHLFIFANHYPDTSKMSNDRWEITEVKCIEA